MRCFAYNACAIACRAVASACQTRFRSRTSRVRRKRASSLAGSISARFATGREAGQDWAAKREVHLERPRLRVVDRDERMRDRHDRRVQPFGAGVVVTPRRHRRIQPLGIGMQRLRFGDQWREIEAAIGGFLQRMQPVAQFVRRLGEVEGEDGRGAEPPAGEQIDLRVADEIGVVNLIERIVRCVPPPGRPTLAGAREAAEDGRHPDPGEGLVVAAALPMIGHRLSEQIAHDTGCDLPRLCHVSRRRDIRCPHAAGGFGVDVADTVIVEISEEIVRVPRRRPVPRVRVAGPEGEPQPASQLTLVLAEDAPDFEHRRVGAGIVHRPVMP